jgi:hypothetical protein
MGTALAASPTLSGHRVAATLLMLLPCSLTSPGKGPTPAKNTKKRFVAVVTMGLALVTLNYVQGMHHLMVLTIAGHAQITLFIRSPCKTGRTC